MSHAAASSCLKYECRHCEIVRREIKAEFDIKKPVYIKICAIISEVVTILAFVKWFTVVPQCKKPLLVMGTDILKGGGERKKALGSEEGTCVCVFAPKRAVYHVFTSKKGRLVWFTNQKRILACVLAPKKAI